MDTRLGFQDLSLGSTWMIVWISKSTLLSQEIME